MASSTGRRRSDPGRNRRCSMQSVAGMDGTAMWEIRVESSFTARHAIRYPGGAIETPHEHTWNVEVRYAGADLDDHGLLVDFVQAQGALESVLRPLDGSDLNTNPVLDGRNPTAEVVAHYVYTALGRGAAEADKCIGVIVEEAPGCRAFFRADPAGGRGPGSASPRR